MNKSNKQDFSIEKIICRLAELGLDENEICFSLDLKKKEFSELKEKREIKTALDKGLENCARKVEQALYQRAVGFEYEETVTSEKPEAKTAHSNKTASEVGSAKSSSKLTLKTVIPDVTACIFWLKNRLPDKWRDPKEIQSDGKKTIQDLVEEYEEKGFEEDD